MVSTDIGIATAIKTYDQVQYISDRLLSAYA